ncbi:hypothetical protein FRC06_007024 [Ceratobasidium sp. 370]|nr:hypothetical protein FRC06_007024 [Ceratobasidium sp. 370]
MAAPILESLGTPAAEWAQQTVQAIEPDSSTGLVTDAHGNPTTDHNASAIGGAPGHGVNTDKTPAQLEAISSNVPPKATDPVPLADETGTEIGNGVAHPTTGAGLFTDAQGNPTTDPNASALEGTPAPGIPAHLVDPTSSNVTTPGVHLPGGWIRGAESRHSSMVVPETSLYEDVSAALGTVGQAAFSALPASVIENLSNSAQAKSPAPDETQTPGNGTVTQNGAPETEEAAKQAPPSPPARTGSPGLLSRAQGMLSGLLARPASPASKLPAPDAPTTTGEAALVGGGAVANTADELGTNISSNQNPDLGGHDPKGVLANEAGDANLQSKATTKRTGLPEAANTAAKFLDAGIATPDPGQPSQDPGLSGSVFPTLADNPVKDKGKAQPVGSTTSPDGDAQAATRKAKRGSSSPVGVGAAESKPSEADHPQPTVTKVSDSGVRSRLLNVRDAVVAPFVGSRAPKSHEEPHSPEKDAKASGTGVGVANVDQSAKASGNAEGIRTAENPHTAHTALAPSREDGTHVGGTGAANPKTDTSEAGGRNLTGNVAGAGVTGDGVAVAVVGNEATGTGAVLDGNGNVIFIPGLSTRGSGQGRVVAYEDGAIGSADVPRHEKEKETKSGGGVTRLFSRSRSRSSVDAGRRASVDDASKSPKGTRSRFSEEQPPTGGSEAASPPTSPSSSRIKVPLRDKIRGELKIISGKVSRNEAKVEEGVALKTGHASETVASPKAQPAETSEGAEPGRRE